MNAALLLLVEDAYREGLLRQSEAMRDAARAGSSYRYWQVYVAEDTAALGAWRALWSVVV